MTVEEDLKTKYQTRVGKDIFDIAMVLLTPCINESQVLTKKDCVK